jgi:cell division septum initiation protein DivIVA
VSYSEYESSARRPVRLTADQVESWDFHRAGMTRRGYDEDGVERFKRRVLAELQTASQVEAELRARNDDLTRQLRATYHAASGSPEAPAGGPGQVNGAMPGPSAAPMPDARVTAAAVNAISMAQQQAEEQIRAAEEYVRNVTEYARNQYQATVNEGHRQGLIAAESAFERRNVELSASLSNLESQLDFLKAFGVAFGVQVEGALAKAHEEVHTMIGTIRTAFDALKNQQEFPVGAGAGAGAVRGGAGTQLRG